MASLPSWKPSVNTTVKASAVGVYDKLICAPAAWFLLSQTVVKPEILATCQRHLYPLVVF